MDNQDVFVKIFLNNFTNQIPSVLRVNFLETFPTFLNLLQAQDFIDIKAMLDNLLSTKKIRQSVYNVILNLLLEQGIDLNNLK